jgi:hypothetical protein
MRLHRVAITGSTRNDHLDRFESLNPEISHVFADVATFTRIGATAKMVPWAEVGGTTDPWHFPRETAATRSAPSPVNQPRLCRRSYVRKNVALLPKETAATRSSPAPVNQPRFCKRSYVRKNVALSRAETAATQPADFRCSPSA